MNARQLAAAAMIAAAAAAGSAAAQDSADPVVGRVDGSEIRQSDIVAAYETLPEEYKVLPVERLHKVLLDRSIDDTLIAAQAKELSFDDDEDIQNRLRMARAQIFREAYFLRVIERKVTEEAMRARYDEMIAEMPETEEVWARHILLESEDDARTVAAEASQEGADFGELAKEHSQGPSASEGGDLGYFAREEMVPEFADAAFALQPGEVTAEPVKTQFGWHVIKVEDRRTREAPAFEELREQIQSELSQAAIAEGIVELRKGAEIERFEFDGSNLVEPDQGEAEEGEAADE